MQKFLRRRKRKKWRSGVVKGDAEIVCVYVWCVCVRERKRERMILLEER